MKFLNPDSKIIPRTLEFLEIKDNPALAEQVQAAIILMAYRVEKATWDKRDHSKKIKIALKAHRR